MFVVKNPSWKVPCLREKIKTTALKQKTVGATLPETNSSHLKNRPSQKESSLPTINFQVLCWFQGG